MKKLLASTLLGLLVLAPAMAQNDLNGPAGTARPVQSAYYSAAQGAPQLGLNSSGSYFGQVFNVAGYSGTWALGYNTVMTANGSVAISWNSSGQVGVGTAAPAGSVLLDVGSTAWTKAAVRVSQAGFLQFHQGTAPTVGSCGTGPSVVTGSDQAGDVTLGTSLSGNGTCTMTFANALTNIPHCFCNDRTRAAGCFAQPTTSTVVFVGSSSAPLIATDVIDFFCVGHDNN